MPATLLCHLSELAPTGARGITLHTATGPRHVVVVETPTGPRAYTNACPHLGMPLEIRPDHFLDAARRHLVCTTHGARFRTEDGYCISGPCRDDALAPVAIRIDGDRILLEE